MKLDEDFKDEVNRQFKEGDYIFRKGFRRVLIVILILAVLCGAIGFAYKKLYVDANREIFKHSIAYTEEAAAFVAKEFREYNATDDVAEQKAIMQYVVYRYPNLDVNEIENQDLRNFYRKCLAGGN